MKLLIVIFAIVMVSACGSSSDKTEGEKIDVTSETSKIVKEAQKLNAELEEIDGELDSLIIKLK